MCDTVRLAGWTVPGAKMPTRNAFTALARIHTLRGQGYTVAYARALPLAGYHVKGSATPLAMVGGAR